MALIPPIHICVYYYVVFWGGSIFSDSYLFRMLVVISVIQISGKRVFAWDLPPMLEVDFQLRPGL